jgi:UrcA family protein
MKLLAIPALLALALAPPAVATPLETRSTAVSPAGLDLASPGGARTMAGRLDRAALRACGASTFSARDVQAEVRRSACYRDAVDRALATLDAPAVNAALRARSPA